MITKHEEIMKELGGIKQHLKTLNGKVAKNVADIEKQRQQQEKDNIDRAKIQGGWRVLVFLGTILMAIGGLLIKYLK